MLKLLNNKSGFTLMETMIVMAIIAISSSFVASQYSNYRNSKALSLAKVQIIDDIKMVQNYSYAVLENNGSFPKGGYGIHFEVDSDSYLIFSDNDGNKIYNNTNSSEDFKKNKLPMNVKITSLNTGEEVSPIDLIFIPPYGDVFINDGSENFIELKIKVENNNSSEIITVNTSRLVY